MEGDYAQNPLPTVWSDGSDPVRQDGVQGQQVAIHESGHVTRQGAAVRRLPGGSWAPVKRRNAVKTTLFRYLTTFVSVSNGSKVNRHIRTRLPCVPTKVSKSRVQSRPVE